MPGLILLALLLGSGCDGSRPGDADASALRIGAVLPAGEAGASLRRGVELGALEAAHAGDLIGRELEILIEEVESSREAARAARRLADRGVFAILGGGQREVCEALSASAADRGFLFLNVGCRHDELRERRDSLTFHIEASDRTYAEASSAGEPDTAAAEPTLWHSGLERFGAAQLNERFERQFGTGADGQAWAGWMALKVLWESALRINTTEPARVASYLVDENTAFDGHKGRSLTFSPEDHQLRQPLYLPASLAGTTVPVEVDPMGGASAGISAREWAELEGRALPPGSYVAVSNEGSGDVTIIDIEELRVVSRVRVGSRPRGIHFGPNGERLYVALSDDAPTVETDDDGIAVIEMSSARVLNVTPVGTDPEVFDLSPDGTTLYASNEDAGTATVTDLRTGEVLATLTVGIEPEGVAMSPDGRWVYVTAETSNTVSVIDARENRVVASFLVDVRPRAAAFSPSRPRAYITNEISATVSVVDTNDHTVIASIPIPAEGATPVGVVVSPDGQRVYVANGHANSVSVIDAIAEEVVAEIPVGRRPWGIGISPDGSRLFTANGLTDDVSVVDTGTLRVVGTVRVGDRPWGVAVTP